MEPVTWAGRWKFLDGWTKVWSCERHADELVGAERLTTLGAIQMDSELDNPLDKVGGI
jgi:hypothetical protein